MTSDKTGCPLRIGLDVSGELLARYSHLHSDREWAAGYLAVFREAVERVHELLPCEPVVNESGQLVCPLNETAHLAINSALHKLGVWSVDLAELDKGPRETFGALL
jgi:hypothetical protein